MKQVSHSEVSNTATKLAFIAKRSQDNPHERMTSLIHLLDEEYLKECWKELKTGKTPGIDSRTKESYSKEEIAKEIAATLVKMKVKQYRPKPVKRTWIEKLNGKLRPLGIPSTVDKIVQQGMKKILEAIYEPHFLDCSYGFRPNRNCHQALKAVYRMTMTKPVNWIIDIDIKGFFDNVNHHWMMECLEQRISDPNFNNLISKFLKAGVMQDGKFQRTDKGTPQGGILSPLLANIYLHYVLDLWFDKALKTEITGYAELIRYADDFVIGAQSKPESERMLQAVKGRLKKFGLEVSPDKTRIIEFGRYAEQNSRNRSKRKPDTFNFLGFTHYCSKSRKGNFLVKVKSDRKKIVNKLREMNKWLKSVRNTLPIDKIWEKLSSKLTGHYNYYGVSSNYKSIYGFHYQTLKLTFKWLNRRSQKKSFNIEQFQKYLELHPLPKPVIAYNLYDIWRAY